MTQFGTDFRIKVSTDQLIRTADSVKNLVDEMRAACEDMNTIVTGTGYYWKGIAGNAKRQLYNEKRETAEEMIRYLSVYPADLLKMAGVYAESEMSNTQLTESLSADVIL